MTGEIAPGEDETAARERAERVAEAIRAAGLTVAAIAVSPGAGAPAEDGAAHPVRISPAGRG